MVLKWYGMAAKSYRYVLTNVIFLFENSTVNLSYMSLFNEIHAFANFEAPKIEYYTIYVMTYCHIVTCAFTCTICDIEFGHVTATQILG